MIQITIAEREYTISRKRILKRLLVVVAIIIAGIIGYELALMASQKTAIPLSQAPIISQEAREKYKRGDISRKAAKSKIETQLDTLRYEGCINAWDYFAGENKYEIELTSGMIFTYYLE